jgi:hypothetical protein
VSKRFIVLVGIAATLFGGAGVASAGLIDTEQTSTPQGKQHQICIGVSDDPNGSGSDQICFRSIPLPL